MLIGSAILAAALLAVGDRLRPRLAAGRNPRHPVRRHPHGGRPRLGDHHPGAGHGGGVGAVDRGRAHERDRDAGWGVDSHCRDD